MVSGPQFAHVWFTGLQNPVKDKNTTVCWNSIFWRGRDTSVILPTCATKKQASFSESAINSSSSRNNNNDNDNNKRMQSTELNSFWETAGVKCQGCQDSVDQKQAETTWKSPSSTQQDISWCGTAQAVWLALAQNGNTWTWTPQSHGPSTRPELKNAALNPTLQSFTTGFRFRHFEAWDDKKDPETRKSEHLFSV